MTDTTQTTVRKIAKRLLYPLLGERFYRRAQALAMASDIRRGKFWEPEIELIPAAVRPGECVLDLGANYGMYCYYLSQAVGETGKVFAFEPVPFTFDTLRMIAKRLRLQNVKLVPKGVSDRNAQISFSVPLQGSGAIAAGQAYIGSRNDDHPGKQEQVRWKATKSVLSEVVALDDFLPPVEDLSFIKADIEGAEYFAFRGAEKLIDRHQPSVLCEINPWFLDGFGIELAELMTFFSRRGYLMYRYEHDQNRLRRIDAMNGVIEDNYFFIPPRRRDRFANFMIEPEG